LHAVCGSKLLSFRLNRGETMETTNLNQSDSQSENGRETLVFTLGKEEYGIDILKVQEIRGYDAVTTIANAPDFIKGVINLRGTIVPIVDMRIKFNLGKVDYDQYSLYKMILVINIVQLL